MNYQWMIDKLDNSLSRHCNNKRRDSYCENGGYTEIF